MGGGDHAYLRGFLAARGPEPAGGACQPAVPGCGHQVPPERPGRDQAGSPAGICHPGRAVRQAAATAGPAGSPGRRGGADRARAGQRVPGRAPSREGPTRPPRCGETAGQWRREWDAARWFLTADGEALKRLGNETVRWDPDEGWLEVKLPAPLAHLANARHGRYRLECPVSFPYRGDEVAAQTAGGAVRYDISYHPGRDRWYLDASWRAPACQAPALEELRAAPVLAVDLNHGHLDAWTVSPDGNPTGPPATVPLELAGLPASQRDGRLRAAVTTLIALARENGCKAIAVENLDFAEARAQGREHAGRRPSRGARGRPAPGHHCGPAHHPLQRPPHPDDRQRRAAHDRGGPGLHLPLVGRALAPPAAGPRAGDDRAPRGRGRHRKTRARPQGAATERRDRA